MDNLEFLKKSLLLKGSSQEDIELVLGLIQERQVKAGTTIFTENMAAEAIYIVKSGSVRISLMAGDGREMGLLLIGPGEFFGELALLQEETRFVTARTEAPTDLLVMTRKDFHALLDLDPRTGSRILMAVAKLLAMRTRAHAAALKNMLFA